MNNTYGIVKPSVIDIQNDVEIWYHYRPSRTRLDSTFADFKQLDPNMVLSQATMDSNDVPNGISDRNLPGMYNLALPASVFSRTGFYTLYIKPKEIPCEIYDVGALAAYGDVIGIVLNLNSIRDNKTLFSNPDALVGYRVEYFSTDGDRESFYRIITSNNLASPMSQNLTNANANTQGYRFNDSGSLVFITLTPSTSPSFKGSERPYIGTPNQRISITNTKFDPVCVEIEICKVDLESIDVSINGSQIRTLENSRVTTYNDNNEPVEQHEMYTLKDNYTNRETMEVKKRVTDDFALDVDADEVLNQ